jgi:hypothetical protein
MVTSCKVVGEQVGSLRGGAQCSEVRNAHHDVDDIISMQRVDRGIGDDARRH